VKRLPFVIIAIGLLTAACGTGTGGSLGQAPTNNAKASSPASQPSTTSPAGQSSQPSAGPSQGGTSSPTRQINLQAWFTRNGKLFAAQRSVPATASVGRTALEGVLAGPTAVEYSASLRSQIPAGTSLLGLRIAAGTATVNLSAAFESAASNSTMPLRIAQVVYTLTQFPRVSGVRFQIGGQAVTVLGGVPVQTRQTRAMFSSFLPAITVQSPVIGAQVSSPVTVSGTADVFEAVVSVRVLDAAGHEITRTFTNASCGTGCRGDYSVAVSFSVPHVEHGTVEVFESSAKNGQPVNVQRIPVTLEP